MAQTFWAKSEEEAARIRAARPGADVQVRGPKQKSGETPAQRAARQERTAAEKATAAAERAANAPKPKGPSGLYRLAGKRVPGGRMTVGAAMVAGGLGAGYAAGKVKKADRKTAERTAAGAAGTYGAYLGGGYAANLALQNSSRKDPKSNAAMARHRARHQLPEGGLAGRADKKAIESFYRTIPHEVKHSGARRLLARTHGVSRAGRLAPAALLAGAGGGYAYDRAKVSKGTNIGEYPYLPQNIREWAEGFVPVRRNPISPLQMLSSGMLMAEAQAASRGINLSRRQKTAIGRGVSNYAEGRMMLYSPIARGQLVTNG